MQRFPKSINRKNSRPVVARTLLLSAVALGAHIYRGYHVAPVGATPVAACQLLALSEIQDQVFKELGRPRSQLKSSAPDWCNCPCNEQLSQYAIAFGLTACNNKVGIHSICASALFVSATIVCRMLNCLALNHINGILRKGKCFLFSVNFLLRVGQRNLLTPWDQQIKLGITDEAATCCSEVDC